VPNPPDLRADRGGRNSASSPREAPGGRRRLTLVPGFRRLPVARTFARSLNRYSPELATAQPPSESTQKTATPTRRARPGLTNRLPTAPMRATDGCDGRCFRGLSHDVSRLAGTSWVGLTPRALPVVWWRSAARRGSLARRFTGAGVGSCASRRCGVLPPAAPKTTCGGRSLAFAMGITVSQGRRCARRLARSRAPQCVVWVASAPT
jgi:hypothetical protein